MFDADADILRFACEQASTTFSDGFCLEVGVCTGTSINFISALLPKKIIYGFDSFTGLPEDWVRPDVTFKAGIFGLKSKFLDQDVVPIFVLRNVKLFKGWFINVLPQFKKEIMKDSPISFLHIDCDIYQSTKDVFDSIGGNIVPGTIILFDEIYNYAGFEVHELKAFLEFLAIKKLGCEFIAYNSMHQQAVVRITV